MKNLYIMGIMALLALGGISVAHADNNRSDDRRSDKGKMMSQHKDIYMRYGSGMTGSHMYGSGMTYNQKSKSGAVLTTEQLNCIRTTTTKRETALISSFSTFSSAVISAYNTRASALSSAWQLTDKTARKTAIDTAWKNWKSSTETARKARKDSHKSAWDTFRSETKTCKVGEDSTDSRNMSMDKID